jgi:iron(III) transport system ATP-binding protein
MTEVRIEGLVKRFGDSTALDGVSLDLPAGRLFTLLGPSGAVSFDGVPVDTVPPYARNIGVVFQSYAIFPHLTVRQNIAYGLHARRLPPGAVAARVAETARLVQLDGLLDRMPAQLSGGQQQRAVLARALVIEPRLLLMDEPLSNLDARLRLQMRALIRRLQRELGITTLYVTHDQEEALAISDVIAVLDRGRVLQTGRPAELYLAPASRFVAEFLGSMNILPGRVRARAPGEDHAVVETSAGGSWRVRDDGRLPGEGPVHLGIRPESLRLAPPPAAEGWNELPGRVTDVAYLGAVVRYEVGVGPGLTVVAEVHDPDLAALRAVGDEVRLWCPAAKVVPLASDR